MPMQEVRNRDTNAARNILMLGLSVERLAHFVRQVQPQAVA